MKKPPVVILFYQNHRKLYFTYLFLQTFLYTLISDGGEVAVKAFSKTFSEESHKVPRVLSITADKSAAGAKITVKFNVNMKKAAAETTGNYAISDGANQAVIESAKLQEDGVTVVLVTKTHPLLDAQILTLTAASLVDDYDGIALTTVDQTNGSEAAAGHNVWKITVSGDSATFTD